MTDRSPSSAEVSPTPNQRAVIESDARSLSVDAGAGTGKTTTMIMRLERAIESGAVDPANVLVVTFANEAASNVRSAIADRLNPSTAAAIDVYTYHSLCYRLVSEYAYYLGLSPSFEVVTERGRRRTLTRLLSERDYDFAATDLPGEEAATPGAIVDRIDRFVATMSRENVDPEQLEAALPAERTLHLLEQLLLWLRREADESLSFDNPALRYFSTQEHLEEAREGLIEYGTLLTFCREKIAEAPAPFREEPVVREVDTYLKTLQRCVTRVRERLDLDDPTTKQLPRVLFCNQVWRQATDTIEQTPVGRLEHYVEFLRQARHYTAIYADYRDQLEADGALDFDELVRTATGLVEDESVAEDIIGKWADVYCDEFQDTDRVQWRLIEALTADEDGPSLLAIGDTDQSIYGWRGTDPRGLATLGAEDPNHERIELETNFRSRQEILDVTNECVYSGGESKTLRERNHGGDGDDKTDPPARVLTVESDTISRPTAEQVGVVLAQLLNGTATHVPERAPGDIAVIVRTNAQGDAVAEELAERQIPFERSGRAGGSLSPGMQTVVSALRVLTDDQSDAGGDVHLRRVLLSRYRVPESDLSRLADHDRGLAAGFWKIDAPESPADTTLNPGDGNPSDAVDQRDPVRSVDDPTLLESLDEPKRLVRARRDLGSLAAQIQADPAAAFIERFLDRTKIAWFLTPDERQELERIEHFAESFHGDDVLGSVSPAFVDALERYLEGGSRDRTQGTESADAVDVMTVHQAKGLEFDTVLVPYLSDEEWCVRPDYAASARYRMLTALLQGDVTSPLTADLAGSPVDESWRVLHVALTRAENHLYLFGADHDYGGGDDSLGTELVDKCLPPSIEWSAAGERMDLWSTLRGAVERVRTSYPETVCEVTASIATATPQSTATITYEGIHGQDRLEPGDALAVSHDLGRLLRGGTLLAVSDAAFAVPDQPPTGRHLGAIDPSAARLSASSLETGAMNGPALRHSYSALETHAACPRKHYLEYVVGAIDDPSGVLGAVEGGSKLDSDSDSGPTTHTPDNRLVGTVFHNVAEEAFYREHRTRSAWKRAATRRLLARGRSTLEEPVHACVDRYFEATTADGGEFVHTWTQLAAELPFRLDDVLGLEGSVVGVVDSVRRTPSGDLVLLDYKATAERIPLDRAAQLALYGRAYEEMYSPVDAVGYVYVGPVDGPRVELRTPETIPAWGRIQDRLETLETPTYMETTPGAHCQRCPHRSLGCGPEEFTDP